MTDAEETLTPPVAPRTFDETASELARTYAEALVNAAQKEGVIDEALQELEAVRALLLEQFPTFAHLLTSPVRSTAEKDRILTELFEGRTLPINARFIRVLNRHGRLDLLGLILREALEVWDRRQNRRPALVRTAVPLTDAQRDALRDRLAKTFDTTPILRLEVDPALIGGMVVQVGDVVYDGSVRNRLEQLRHRLTEGKTHAIQSRRDHFSHSE